MFHCLPKSGHTFERGGAARGSRQRGLERRPLRRYPWWGGETPGSRALWLACKAFWQRLNEISSHHFSMLLYLNTIITYFFFVTNL